MPTYKELQEHDLSLLLFAHFQRRQTVTKCFRKIEDLWCVKDIAFTDDWMESDYAMLVTCLKNTAGTGGLVLGAFVADSLKGFASVEPQPLGKNKDYLDLSSLHVSEELRGQGIGKALFLKAKRWAKEQGARKLYISAHSAVETQAFYRALGCVEAEEYSPAHVEREPCDCQLECLL